MKILVGSVVTGSAVGRGERSEVHIPGPAPSRAAAGPVARAARPIPSDRAPKRVRTPTASALGLPPSLAGRPTLRITATASSGEMIGQTTPVLPNPTFPPGPPPPGHSTALATGPAR